MLEITFSSDLSAVVKEFSDLLLDLGCPVFRSEHKGFMQVWGSSLFFGERDRDHQFHGSKCGGDGYGWNVIVYWSETTLQVYGRDKIVPDKPEKVWFGSIDAMDPVGMACDHAWGIEPDGIKAPKRPYFSVDDSHARAQCWCQKYQVGQGPDASPENLKAAWDRFVDFMASEYKAANLQARAVRDVMDFGKNSKLSELRALARELRGEQK